MSQDERTRFEIAGGSVTGRSHVLAGRGNQDAYAIRNDGDRIVAVVCDGCGSGAHSEVGAALGARMVTALLMRRLAEGADLDDGALFSSLGDDVLAALRPAARAAGERLGSTVSDLFLFTVLGVAVQGDRGCVFASGDGIVVVDGETRRLGPFPGDAPPYIGYGLLGDDAPKLSVVQTFSATDVRRVLIGTDGAAALADLDGGQKLAALWDDERHFRNRDGVRRTLALWNRDEVRPLWDERILSRTRGLLEDDATLVMLRRKGA
ncbi:Serine phosphatase RsbU, regulator of sigma subunit protein [Minicystis rosea]|nr:Serine phosphatase RsbU, regulator of sigma subunit protein [Minicystis rosea]